MNHVTRPERSTRSRVVPLFTPSVKAVGWGGRHLDEWGRCEGGWAIEASVRTERGQLVQPLGESGQPSPAFLPSRARLH